MKLINQKWIILCIVFLILLNSFILFKFTVNRKRYKEVLDHIELFKTDQLISYENNFRLNLFNDGIGLENMTLKDTLNREIKINDLLLEKDHLLICRISELYCQECITYSIVKIINTSKTMERNNIIFLCSHTNNNSMRHIKEQFGTYEISMYHVSGLNIPAESMGYPYYFIVDKNLKVSNLFIPNKSTPNLINEYLEVINQRYFTAKDN